MRYIEMVGLPAAGKTSLRRRWGQYGDILTLRDLVDRERRGAALEHRRRMVRRLPVGLTSRLLQGGRPTAGDAARFATDHPHLQELVWALASAVPDSETRAVALGLLWDTWADRRFAERVGGVDEGVLLDEGIWQRLAYLLAVGGARVSDDVPAIPAPLPRLDGLIIIEVPADLAARRVLARDHGFKDVELLPAMEAILQHLVAMLRATGTPCLTVDGTRPVRRSLVELQRFVSAGVG